VLVLAWMTPAIENEHDHRIAEGRVKTFRRGIEAAEHAGPSSNVAPTASSID
jgi:hypothetical protein